MVDPVSVALQNQVILSTRPAHQQARLQFLLESNGASVLSFPTIAIADIKPDSFHLNLKANITHYDIILFVSRNAVLGAFRFLDSDNLPARLELGVIGEGTYQALTAQIPVSKHRLIRSQPYNSEGLLNSTELQRVKNRNILIFRGQPGRSLLGDELARRGATINYCEVYRRELPQYPQDYYQQLCNKRVPTLAVFTSNEGMLNTFELVDHLSKLALLQTPWLLISERMRESAAKLGHNAEIVIASNASDEGIHQTIIEWASWAESDHA